MLGHAFHLGLLLKSNNGKETTLHNLPVLLAIYIKNACVYRFGFKVKC